jgi:chromosome segregation ATPase
MDSEVIGVIAQLLLLVFGGGGSAGVVVRTLLKRHDERQKALAAEAEAEKKARDQELADLRDEAGKVVLLEEKMTVLAKELAEQRHRNEEQINNFQRVLTLYEAKTKDHAVEEERNRRLMQDKNRVTQELDIIKEERDNLRKEIQGLRVEIDDVKVKYSELRLLLEQASDRANNAEREHERLQQHNHDLSIEIEAMKRATEMNKVWASEFMTMKQGEEEAAEEAAGGVS